MSILKEVTVSTKDLATLFGVASKYISQLVKKGMPNEGHNKFNLYECVKWRFEDNEKIYQNDKKKIREENTKSRLELANAELKELELAERRGSLIDSKEVYQSKMNDATIYVKGLDALGTKLPPVLIHAKNEEEISTTIKKETDNIRNQIATIPANTAAAAVNFE